MTLRRESALRLVVALAGLGAALAMARHVDVGALRALGRWAALLVALEGLRIVCESQATRALYGASLRVSTRRLLYVHAVSHAIATAMPAGRLAAEASKAVMFTADVGATRVAQVAASMQTLGLLSSAVLALPCALAAWGLGATPLAAALAVQGAALLALAAVLIAALRHESVRAWCQRRMPGWEAARGGDDRVAVGALGWMILQRSLPIAQLGLLLSLLGAWDPLRALGLGGAAMVGSTVGDAVPGQLGVLGGALALAAPGLGLRPASALAMAVAIHAAQFVWVAFGAVLSWAGRGHRSPTRHEVVA